MNGKQHRQGNAFMSIPITIYLIMYLGFNYWYLGIPAVMIWNADFEDIDQYQAVPKKWKAFKKWFIFGLKTIVVLALLVLVYSFYMLFIANSSLSNNELKAFIASITTLIFLSIAYWYTTTDNGRFLLAHRGFTHTLVIPATLFSLYSAISNAVDRTSSANTDVQYYLINVGKELLCVFILGFIFGCLGHTFLDSLCEAGVPLLWPISKSTISFGHAKTSDKKAKDKTHISSKIYTYVVCVISLIISAILIYRKLK